MNRSEILAEADKLINGDREAVYGPPIINFTNIAAGWSVLLGVPVKASQVAKCMSWVKQCRTINSPDHMDSYVDAAAYDALAGELAMAEAAPKLSPEERIDAIKIALGQASGVFNDPTPGYEYAGQESIKPGDFRDVVTGKRVDPVTWSVIDPEADGPTDFGR